MSDAISEAYANTNRNQIWIRAYRSYIKALIDYLSDPSEEKLQEVVSLAEGVDYCSGGPYYLWGSCLAEGIREKIELLMAGDETEWSSLLLQNRENSNEEGSYFSKLLALSPFAGSGVMTYSQGVLMARGLLVRVLTAKGCEKCPSSFLIVFPEEAIEKAEIVHARPGKPQ